MARRLARTVTVQKYTGHGLNRVPDGEPVTFPKHATPPKEWADLITNPSAWEDVPEPVLPAAATAPAKKAVAKKAPAKKAAAGKPAVADAEKDDGTGDESAPADDAGDEAWRAYAATVGVTVAEDADTAAVKAELDERGLLEQ
jgi:hypothetical protein